MRAARLGAAAALLALAPALAGGQALPGAAGIASTPPAGVPASASGASAPLAGGPAPAPLRIGEINSYTTVPQFILPWRQGWQLALEQINAAGGVLGRPLEMVARDDAGRPDEATRQARELVTREKVVLLTGTHVSTTALAVSAQAARDKVVFLAGAPLTDALVWERGNRYTFRVRPSTYMHAAALAEEAVRLPGRSWYVIAPNYEYGQSMVASFRSLLKARRPDVAFVGEQWPALAKLQPAGAAAIVKAALDAKADAVFTALFGPDLAQLVREGKRQGLFPRVPVLAPLAGDPEYLDILRDDVVPGWIVTGYPVEQIDTPAHRAFVEAYQQRFGALPRSGSLLGYLTMQAAAEALRRAGSTQTEALIRALRGLQLATPVGPVTVRAIDQQASLGVYLGRIEVRGEGARARGVLTGWRYLDGNALAPAEALVRARRPDAAVR